MTNSIASLTSSVLEQITRGATEAELQPLLLKLGQDAGDPEVAQKLHAQLASLMKQPSGSALTERGLNLLIDTTHDLSRTLSLQDLLRKIVSRARNLVSANIAWLTMLDEEKQVFRNFAIEGNLSPGTAHMSSSVDRGVVSLIAETRSFFVTKDYLGDDRFRHSRDLDRRFEDESIKSLAGFPILADDKVQGLLFVADRYGRDYSGREISVLGSFAQHAGVAMRNARIFSRLSEALEETERNRSSLEEHIQRVEASAQAHDDMMSLLARGADLMTFMQRMAGNIGGSIQYLDSNLAIREEFTAPGFNGTLNKDIRAGRIDQAKMLSAIARSRENGRSAVLIENSNERCLILALHGGATRGDSLVVCHTGKIDEIQLRNLERSTVALSIAKLWAEKRHTERLIASSTLLRHLVLVSPPDAPTIDSARNRLSLSSEQPIRMALMVVSGMDRAEQTELIRDAGGRLNVLVDLIDDAYLAIGPISEMEKLTTILSRRVGKKKIGGLVSAPFTELETSPQHYAELGNAMRAMKKIAPLSRFIDAADISLFARIFERSDPSRIKEFVAGVLAPIAARDPRNRAHLKTTLLCFFDNHYNIARTAERLDVHVNTVRQRLDTLREVTGGWKDPIASLELHVALRLDDLASSD